MKCSNIIGNGGGPINGIQGGKVFNYVDTDFTIDGSLYYVDVVHGFNDVIMELQVDIGAGLVLGSPAKVDDSTPGTRRVWVNPLPDAAEIKIIGVL